MILAPCSLISYTWHPRSLKLLRAVTFCPKICLAHASAAKLKKKHIPKLFVFQLFCTGVVKTDFWVECAWERLFVTFQTWAMPPRPFPNSYMPRKATNSVPRPFQKAIQAAPHTKNMASRAPKHDSHDMPTELQVAFCSGFITQAGWLLMASSGLCWPSLLHFPPGSVLCEYSRGMLSCELNKLYSFAVGVLLWNPGRDVFSPESDGTSFAAKIHMRFGILGALPQTPPDVPTATSGEV